MTLYLQTDANPGDAEWGAAPSGGSDTLALFITMEAAGAAPAIDPDGLRNICYVLDYVTGGSTAVLPAITPTLSPVWRITVASVLHDAQQWIVVSPDAGDTIIGSTDNAIYLAGDSVDAGRTIPGAFAIFVHDGTSQWMMIAYFVGVPL